MQTNCRLRLLSCQQPCQLIANQRGDQKALAFHSAQSYTPSELPFSPAHLSLEKYAGSFSAVSSRPAPTEQCFKHFLEICLLLSYRRYCSMP